MSSMDSPISELFDPLALIKTDHIPYVTVGESIKDFFFLSVSSERSDNMETFCQAEFD